MLESCTNELLFVGIDGGGSKCKAIIAALDPVSHNVRILGEGHSGPANPFHGFEQAINSITEAATLALAETGLIDIQLSDLNAGIGLAGVNLPEQFQKISAWQHPFKEIFLATDLLIACLGAHQGNDGAVIVSGTGSCGFSYIDQEPMMIGGHGFPHGDKGSGAWFGLQAVKQVLLSLDGLSKPSVMNDRLLSFLHARDSLDLVEKIADKPVAFYGSMANIVFDAADLGDDLAHGIITEGAEYINRVARTLLIKNPPRLSFMGGLTARLTPWLAQDIQKQLVAPINPPECGAVLFAHQEIAHN